MIIPHFFIRSNLAMHIIIHNIMQYLILSVAGTDNSCEGTRHYFYHTRDNLRSNAIGNTIQKWHWIIDYFNIRNNNNCQHMFLVAISPKSVYRELMISGRRIITSMDPLLPLLRFHFHYTIYVFNTINVCTNSLYIYLYIYFIYW